MPRRVLQAIKACIYVGILTFEIHEWIDNQASYDFFEDQDPIPRNKQTWTVFDFIGYWISDLVNVTSWQLASTPLMAGLGSVDSIMIVFLSGVATGIPIGMEP